MRLLHMTPFSVALLLTAPASAQHPVPPPPPPEYDPIPGPFAVRVDTAGSMEDAGVLDTAIASWAGPTLSAFSLCTQQGGRDIDAGVTLQALWEVARGLRARGAAIVVMEPGHHCRTPPIANEQDRFYVEVRGMIRVLR